MTSSAFLCCSACHKSYCVCWFSQLSEDVLKAIERRTSISGLMPALPFKMLDNVLRLMQRPLAASVIVKPKDSSQSSFITSPGCGGLSISIMLPQ